MARRIRSAFAGHGLHLTSRELGQDLTDRFTGNPVNGTGRGYFLGVEFLRDLVQSLKAGRFDGVLIEFGESSGGDRELVATQLAFNDRTTYTIGSWGDTYTSVPGGGPEPPSLGSPPLGNP